MKTMWWAAGLAAAVLGSMPGQAQVLKEEFFSDTFSGTTRDNTKWRDSVYLDGTARFRISNGKVVLSRNPNVLDPFQQVEWDARFTRLYDDNDYLQVGATVRVPNKIRSGAGAFSVGIGLIGDGIHFVELAVEENAESRAFVLFLENADTDTSDTLVFDAPQNISIFDLVITYTAATDALAFYWSVPGVNRLFRIGEILRFSGVIGGAGPRRIQPYMIGLIYEDAPVPASWRVNLDDFYAFREDAL